MKGTHGERGATPIPIVLKANNMKTMIPQFLPQNNTMRFRGRLATADAVIRRPKVCKTMREVAPSGQLPAATDLSSLHGARVALVADDENVRIGALRQQCRFSYALLLERVTKEAKPVAAIAVITASPGDDGRQNYLETRGWQALVLPREQHVGANGTRLYTNVDTDLGTETGFLLGTATIDVLLICSGDGDLCLSIARAAARHRPNVRVITLAVPGSTSHRLWKRRDLFAAHIALGRDLTRPLDRQPQPSTRKNHV